MESHQGISHGASTQSVTVGNHHLQHKMQRIDELLKVIMTVTVGHAHTGKCR